jgi:hypothetical protein
MTCLQLEQEGRAVSKRGFAASGLSACPGGSDLTEAAPAIVFVWPVSSNVGDKQRSDKIASANKEMDALLASAASDFNDHPIRVRPASPAVSVMAAETRIASRASRKGADEPGIAVWGSPAIHQPD